MIESLQSTTMNLLNNFDPSVFFVLSLFPYLFFLYWAKKCKSIPKISLWGFRLTLLFVLMTIVFAILSLKIYGDELTNVDTFHGAAESFLTLSDALIVWGFVQVLIKTEVNNS